MSLDIEQYPFRKRRDLRSAAAETLAQYIAGLEFAAPASATPFKLKKTYFEWAEFERNALTSEGLLPAAAILPDRAAEEDSQLSPSLIEDTWISDGVNGYGLFKLSEKNIPFLLVVRAASKPQRQAIVSTIEDAFVEVDALNRPTPLTYGRFLTMDSYYQRRARYTHLSNQIFDQEASAKESRYLAQFEIMAQAPHVVLRAVPAMDPRIRVVVDQVGAYGTTQG